MTLPFEKRNSSIDRSSARNTYQGKGDPVSSSAAEAANKNNGDKKTMTEREKLQASLKATLTEFKQKSAMKENRNGQAAQGGQKNQTNNRLVGNYLVGKQFKYDPDLLIYQVKQSDQELSAKSEKEYIN